MYNNRISWSQIMLHCISILFALACIIPFFVMISASFSNEGALSEFGYGLWPTKIDLTAYKYLFDDPTAIFRSYGVTILITAATTVFGVLFMSMAAFPLARPNCTFKRPLSFFIFFTMLFSGGLVPSYILITQYLNMKNTIWVLIIPTLINAFYIIMIRTFFQSLPESLYEAAKIDGATEIRIYVTIAMPLSKPVLATVAFFTAMGKWNDWYTPLLYISNEQLMPLQYLLYRIQSNVKILLDLIQKTPMPGMSKVDIPGDNLIMAMAVVAIGPMLVIFPFFQRYFLQGLTVGSVKG